MQPAFRPKLNYRNVESDKAKYNEYLRELAQKAIDYLAGMMDTYATEKI